MITQIRELSSWHWISDFALTSTTSAYKNNVFKGIENWNDKNMMRKSNIDQIKSEQILDQGSYQISVPNVAAFCPSFHYQYQKLHNSIQITTYVRELFAYILDHCDAFCRNKCNSWEKLYQQCQPQCPMLFSIYPNSWLMLCCYGWMRDLCAFDFRECYAVKATK